MRALLLLLGGCVTVVGEGAQRHVPDDPVVVRVHEPGQRISGILIVLHDQEGAALEWAPPSILGEAKFVDPPKVGTVTVIRDGFAVTTAIKPGDEIDLVPPPTPDRERVISIVYPELSNAIYFTEGPGCYLSSDTGSLVGRCAELDQVIVRAFRQGTGVELGYAEVELVPDALGRPLSRGTVETWRTDYTRTPVAVHQPWSDARVATKIEGYVGDRRSFASGAEGSTTTLVTPRTGERFVVDVETHRDDQAMRILDATEQLPIEVAIDFGRSVHFRVEAIHRSRRDLAWSTSLAPGNVVYACAGWDDHGFVQWCFVADPHASSVRFPELPEDVAPQSPPTRHGVMAVAATHAGYDQIRVRPNVGLLAFEIPDGLHYTSSLLGQPIFAPL